MEKISCVVSSCLDTYSGYGRRSLDIVKELIRNYPDWDIKLLSQKWGECRMGFLEDHDEKDLISRVIPNLTSIPDIWIQITIPEEFQKIGKYNIGITAATETTLCSPEWIQGCNRMDLVLVSSEHGKRSLVNSKYIDQRTSSNLEITTKIETLFEGIDRKIYFEKTTVPSKSLLQNVDTEWNFLVVGHWLPGVFGEDRKNIGYTIKQFYETFKDYSGKAPGLILKLTRATSSILDGDEILRKIYEIRDSVKFEKSLPDVYLFHGEISDSEMNDLYNDPKVKALVSFTKGEGFGRPLLEFAFTGKPILVSGWSGQLDFLDKDSYAFVGGTLDKVHSSAVNRFLLAEAEWFRPNDENVAQGFESVYTNYVFWEKKSKKNLKNITTNFNIREMGKKLKTILDENLPTFSKELNVVLP